MALLALVRAAGSGSPLLRTFAPCAAAAVALQAAAAAPSLVARSERFFDAAGSATAVAVAALSLCLPGARPSWRQEAVTAMAVAWAVRLGAHLFRRIRAAGRDSRFDGLRDRPGAFALAFVAQAVWVLAVLSPVLALNAVPAAAVAAAAPGLAATDVAGVGAWAAGLALEAAADAQRSRWARERRAKLHDEPFMARGLFSTSRFPHYFGEITLWTGLATVAAGVLARRPAQLALGLAGGPPGVVATTALCCLSPAFTALLVTKVSGIPITESKYDERYGHRRDYQEWKRNTPRLVPKLW